MNFEKYKLVLMFHDLKNQPRSKYDFKWIKFKRYIFLLNFIFRLINKKIENKLLFTFDDGYYSSMIAARYLQKYYKINSIIFITTKNIDKPGFIKKNNLKNKSTKVNIGSHGVNHISLSKNLSYEEIYKELSESKKLLAKLTRTKISKLSFPNGIYCKKTLKIAYDLNYNYIFTSKRSSNRRKESDKTINRFVITNNTPFIMILAAYTGILDQIQTFKKSINVF